MNRPVETLEPVDCLRVNCTSDVPIAPQGLAALDPWAQVALAVVLITAALLGLEWAIKDARAHGWGTR